MYPSISKDEVGVGRCIVDGSFQRVLEERRYDIERVGMRKLSVLGLVVGLALMTLVSPAIAAPSFQNTELTAELRGGAEEVPNPGDPDGMGTATVTLDMAANQILFTINVSNLTLPAAAAHIHEGAAGVSGPVVVPFTAPGADGAATGSIAVDAALMKRIQQNPAGFYVNVHTSDFAGGAVRGQLAMSGSAAPAAPAAPATLPATGASTDLSILLAGSALVLMGAGLSLRLNSRRRTGTR